MIAWYFGSFALLTRRWNDISLLQRRDDYWRVLMVLAATCSAFAIRHLRQFELWWSMDAAKALKSPLCIDAAPPCSSSSSSAARALQEIISAKEAATRARTPNTASDEVFWVASAWRRTFGSGPPDIIENCIKDFLDEPAGWRKMIGSAIKVFDDIAGGGSCMGLTLAVRLQDIQKLAQKLREIQERLDDLMWSAARAPLLNAIATRAEATRLQALGQYPCKLSLADIEELEGMAHALGG